MSGASRLRAACHDRALHLYDRGDVGMPIGVGEYVGRIEDSDDAGFIAIASMIAALPNCVMEGGRRPPYPLMTKAWCLMVG